ncbi:inner membrane magnesium transporter mrs2 [Drepanopeziza brunnea f. sp. 'multigermtubi' MB_m1]|uniref:Magnesium transporter n=1 Tax=Marssonina brunnea f. sp. multigermtubi (strain MB_m1) TaxID=1072389 RepID=K1XPX9_MARBU|nr:inner membrane magnesium transporter mrs2 [Drepanopeziza brunnea f. sp. 'multigermtubi' MB_m1]EKD14594.1 inner membrane magnesium transporter mrs2 [Drepanopeziza brunnea f. sp. 'multigermtubi' MB_m1]
MTWSHDAQGCSKSTYIHQRGALKQEESERICFFSANPRPGFIFDHAAPRSSQLRARRLNTASTTRRLSTSAPRRATVEAGILNLGVFWPRYTSTALKIQSASSNCIARHRRAVYGGSLVAQRAASAGSKNWHQKLWGVTSLRGGRPLRPDDLPASLRGNEEESDMSMFSLGRHISAKAAAQPRLRCTEFDEHGNVVLASGEFKKSELIAKYGLLPRDLRKIDSSLLPHILVRPSAILINLLHLRVLIKANRVLVFDAYGTTDSYNQSAFIYDLEDKLRQKQASPLAGGLPYEFRALEAVLISAITSLEKEFEGVRKPVVRVLRELEEDIDRDKLRKLLIYSKKLGTFEQKAKLVRDAIDEVLEADDDLAAMYLTEKSHDLLRGEDDHTEVEMLLESYYKLCDEIVQESGNLVSNIRNTEEIIKAILDANRNSLMLLDLKFSIGTLGIGSGAFIAALYGMNLKNFMEESDIGFWGVTGWSVVFTGIVFAYGLTKLRKVQRVSMWGEGGRRGRSWRDEDVVQRDLESERISRQRLRRLNEVREKRVENVGIGALAAKSK